MNPLTNEHQLQPLVNSYASIRIAHKAACKGQDWPCTPSVSLIHTRRCLTDASANAFSLQATYIWQGSAVTFQGRFKVPQSTFITNLGLSPALPNCKVRRTICTAYLVTCWPSSSCCCVYRIYSFPLQPWGLENRLPPKTN